MRSGASLLIRAGPRCFPAGVSCSDDQDAEDLSYAQCCSQPNPETLEYVRDSGECLPCGRPVGNIRQHIL